MRGLLLAALLSPQQAFAASAPRAIERAPAPEFAASVESLGSTYHFDLYEVRFPSPVVSRFPPNNTIWARLYVPRDARGKPPCVLLLPVMAAPNLWIEKRFIYALLWRRYAVLEVELPFQFHRVPRPGIPSGQVFLARRAETLAANFSQAVLDARRAVDWLRRCPRVDGNRVALLGISLGALVGSAMYSVDPRPLGAVFLLGGADFPDLVLRGEMTRAFLKQTGIRADELRRAWRGLDPLDYRERNRGKKTFLVNVTHDLVIPPENARKLRDAFPDSTQIWLPLGHYTALLHILWVPGYAATLVSRILG